MTCSTCKHATEKVTDKGYETGFLVCALGKPWQWNGPKSLCAFNPSRFEISSARTAVASGERGQVELV